MAAMTVWTKQHVSVLDTLEREGRYVAKRRNIAIDAGEDAGIVFADPAAAGSATVDPAAAGSGSTVPGASSPAVAHPAAAGPGGSQPADPGSDLSANQSADRPGKE